MKKIFLLFGMMFILMLSLASAESSDLIAHYDCEDRITDQKNSYDLSGSTSYSTDTIDSTGKSCVLGTTTHIYNSALRDEFYYNKNFSWAVEFKYDTDPTSTGYAYIIADDNTNGDRWILGYIGGTFGAYFTSTSVGGESGTSVSDTPSVGEWYRIVMTYTVGDTRPKIYFNDTIFYSGSTAGANPLDYLAFGHTSFSLGGKIDNMRLYDQVLTDSEAQEYLDYGEVNVVPPHNYTVTTTQDPTNLSTASIGTLRINATVNDSLNNISDLNSSYATLNYTVTAIANSGCGYINLNDDSCNSLDVYENMTNLSISEFTYFTNELHYLPALYSFNQSWIQEQVMSEHTIKGSTFIRFNVQNMTTNQSDIVNVEYNIEPYSTLGSYSLLVVYCNSSYTTGSVDPTLNSNCALLDEKIPTDSFNHCHSLESCHYVTRLNKDVNWTETGYFFFGTLGTSTTDSWLVNYVENASYTTQSFSLTTNNGVSWTPSNHIADIHLHQFAITDNINYSVTFYDVDNSQSKESEYVVDYFDFANAPPSTFIINEPNLTSVYTINSTGVDILIDWEPTTDPEEDEIEYKVGLSRNGLIPSENLSGWLNESTTNYTYTFDSSSYSHGDYRIFVYARDENGASVLSPMTGTFEMCVSNWVSTEQICIDGISNNTYSDSNNCPIEYEKPDSFLTNCTIQTGNTDMTLIIIWGLFGLLAIFIISRGSSSGWFFLGLVVLLFSLTSLHDITDETILHVVGYVFSIIFMALSLTQNTFGK